MDNAEAEQCYAEALRHDPRHAQAHCNCGAVLEEMGWSERAEASSRATLELLPDYAEARANLAHWLLKLGRQAEGWLAYEAYWDGAARRLRRTRACWSLRSRAWAIKSSSRAI